MARQGLLALALLLASFCGALGKDRKYTPGQEVSIWANKGESTWLGLSLELSISWRPLPAAVPRHRRASISRHHVQPEGIQRMNQ